MGSEHARVSLTRSWKLVQAALIAPPEAKKGGGGGGGGILGLFESRGNRAPRRRATDYAAAPIDVEDETDDPVARVPISAAHPFRGGRTLAQVRQDEAAASAADPASHAAMRQARLEAVERAHRAARSDQLQVMIEREAAVRRSRGETGNTRGAGFMPSASTSATATATASPPAGASTVREPTSRPTTTSYTPTRDPPASERQSAPQSPSDARPVQRARVESSAPESPREAPPSSGTRVTFAVPAPATRSRSSTLERADRALERSSPRPDLSAVRRRSGSGSGSNAFSLAAVTARTTGLSAAEITRSTVSRSRTLEARQARGRGRASSGSRDEPLVVLSDSE